MTLKQGLGVPAEPDRAVRLLRTACKLGHQDACDESK